MASIRLMQDADVVAVAAIHAATLTEGFLTKLGRPFLRQLYLGIAQDPGACVFVADDGGRIAGFSAYSDDVNALYRRVLRARGLRLALSALPAAVNPWVIREVFDTLRYPGKQEELRLPAAELLSIGVAANVRGGGVGRQLVEAIVARARADGKAELKVMVGAELRGANVFYERCGFALADVITQHGKPLNAYVMRL